jgi:hypothetical protein
MPFTPRTPRQAMVLMIAPIITGTISAISSITLITMIFRSNLKLSTIYRRLVTGMCVFDVIHSIGRLVSTVPMPAGSAVAAVGNNISCNAQGVMITVGLNGSLLYSLSLSIYFLSIIKLEMSEKRIKEKFERYLHGIPILYAIVSGIATSAAGAFNPTILDLNHCSINPSPANCQFDPDLECQNMGIIALLSIAFYAWPLALTFLSNIVMMLMIWCLEYKLAKKNQRYASRCYSHIANRGSSSTIISNAPPHQESSLPTTQPMSPLAARLSRPSSASIQRRKEIRNRTFAYIFGFLLSFTFSIIFRLWAGFSSDYPPFSLQLLSEIFVPLQGLFNILIYTYPHAVSFRRNNSEYSCFRVFWEVVKSGGDSDQLGRSTRNTNIFSQGRKRRNSVRNEPVVLDTNHRSLKQNGNTL